MANHKSAKKRIKQNAKRNLRNRSLRSALRTELKKFVGLVEAQKMEEASKALPFIHKVIDKACTKGVIHKNKASRAKSKMSLLVRIS